MRQIRRSDRWTPAERRDMMGAGQRIGLRARYLIGAALIASMAFSVGAVIVYGGTPLIH
jgi:hypothetical protein